MRKFSSVEILINKPAQPLKVLYVDMFIEAKQPVEPNTLIVSDYDGIFQVFGNRFMLNNLLVGVFEVPTKRRIRLTIFIEKSSGLVEAYVDGKKVYSRRTGKTCDFEQGTPKLILGGSSFVGRVCNVQMWSEFGSGFLPDLFLNKPYLAPGNLIGVPLKNEFKLLRGAKKETAKYL